MLNKKKDLLRLAFSDNTDLIFDQLASKYEIVADMINVDQESPHHQEKTLEAHIKMVLKEMNKLCHDQKVDKQTRLVWMLSALLHDCAKKHTRKIKLDKITGLPKPTFYGHELAGEIIARKFLNGVLKHKIIDKISLIIKYHMAHCKPLDQWTDKSVRKMKENIAGRIDGKDLLAIFTSDNLGRIADNIRDIPDLVKEKLKEI